MITAMTYLFIYALGVVFASWMGIAYTTYSNYFPKSLRTLTNGIYNTTIGWLLYPVSLLALFGVELYLAWQALKEKVKSWFY